ncbi:MAG: FAD-dependent oxidoreductase [Candidatus Saccharimonadales bacterium]
MANKRHILILGGGFGGIKAAMELEGHSGFEVSLISDSLDFRYNHNLYKAATGGNFAAVSIPLKEIFTGKDVRLIIDAAKTLDREDRTVKTGSGKVYSYDALIVALGSVTNFFDIKGLKQYSYGIKTVEEAKRLRNHLHKQLIDDEALDINYLVVGGGPTGVELAGALPGYIANILKHHRLPARKVNVRLIEAAPRLLPNMPAKYSRAVAQRLRQLGVALKLGEAVQAESVDELTVGGHKIKSHTVIWTAGVTANPFLKSNLFSCSKRGKANVDTALANTPNVYVIGDNAETPYSGMAQTALYDAVFVADNLKRLSSGHYPHVYKPKKPIYITPAGSRWAAVFWKDVQVFGTIGWLLRSIADFVSYSDIEPWWKASKRWLANNDKEEGCPLCS